MASDPRVERFSQVLEAVVTAPGELDTAARRAAVTAGGAAPLDAYLRKVAEHAPPASLSRFQAGLRVLQEGRRCASPR